MGLKMDPKVSQMWGATGQGLCAIAEKNVPTPVLSSCVHFITREEKYLSEVGFEPTPTDVDCDLNAAP